LIAALARRRSAKPLTDAPAAFCETKRSIRQSNCVRTYQVQSRLVACVLNATAVEDYTSTSSTVLALS
jgi:hypothetical protein